jgi:phosphodiesterase/alkaline phosphatase D-like protein
VVLWGRSDAVGNLTFEYGLDSTFSSVVGSSILGQSDALAPVKLGVTGLNAATRYFYRVTDSLGASATGTFTTAAPLGTAAGLRFGVSGDWRGDLLPYPAVANAPARNLDFFVSLGDTVYADVASPANGGQPQAQSQSDFRNKHAEAYAAAGGLNAMADLRQSTALFATIDDHEVTNDFAGGATIGSDPRFAGNLTDFINDSALYDNGLQAFLDYNPIATESYGATGDARTANELKLYRNRTFGSDAALMVLDARSFRDQELPGVTNPTDPVQVGTFLAQSFNPTRTMLGREQVDELKTDLLAAQQNDVLWKFVMVPEPIQNLGVVAASDRFEGYAAERTEILRFINDNNIENVVFVAADVHGTLVNNLTYQLAPGGAQIATNAFEITTGSVAYDAPFGPTVAGLAALLGLLTPQQFAFYNALPIAPDADNIPNDRDDFIEALTNGQLGPLGYDPIGLDASLAQANGRINAQLLQGDYAVTHTYGWTEFEIDPLTRALLVTTYGILPYTDDEVAAARLSGDFSSITSRTPTIVSQFRVTPVPVPAAVWLLGGAFASLARLARRRG